MRSWPLPEVNVEPPIVDWFAPTALLTRIPPVPIAVGAVSTMVSAPARPKRNELTLPPLTIPPPFLSVSKLLVAANTPLSYAASARPAIMSEPLFTAQVLPLNVMPFPRIPFVFVEVVPTTPTPGLTSSVPPAVVRAMAPRFRFTALPPPLRSSMRDEPD